jgi:hypothetical protein
VQPQYKSVLVHRPGLELHYTNFVEIMAPMLRVDALEHVLHTMDTDECKSGWGLDQLWPTMLDFSNIAVIDATPLTHTRPQNAFNVNSSFYTTYKIDPQREAYDLQRRFRFADFRKRSFLEVVARARAAPVAAPAQAAPVAAPAQAAQVAASADDAARSTAPSAAPTAPSAASTAPSAASTASSAAPTASSAAPSDKTARPPVPSAAPGEEPVAAADSY